MAGRLIPLEPGLGEEKDIADLGTAYKVEITARNKQAFFESRVPQGAGSPGRVSYAGSDSCAPCHPAQYEIWQATPHARAHGTLVQAGAQYRAECLVCHTTGYGQPGGYAPGIPQQTAMANVQCESCHGPGSGHATEKKPILRSGGMDLCLTCHTEKNSPKFDYAQYLELVKCAGAKN